MPIGRSAPRGQTIRIGKTIGVAPLVGEYDDVCRWLKDLVTDGLSLQDVTTWQVVRPDG